MTSIEDDEAEVAAAQKPMVAAETFLKNFKNSIYSSSTTSSMMTTSSTQGSFNSLRNSLEYIESR